MKLRDWQARQRVRAVGERNIAAAARFASVLDEILADALELGLDEIDVRRRWEYGLKNWEPDEPDMNAPSAAERRHYEREREREAGR
jgi:hypothetical protein